MSIMMILGIIVLCVLIGAKPAGRAASCGVKGIVLLVFSVLAFRFLKNQTPENRKRLYIYAAAILAALGLGDDVKAWIKTVMDKFGDGGTVDV